MLHGDISNKQAPIIAFNADTMLFNESYEDVGKLKSLTKGVRGAKWNFLNRDLNKQFIQTLRNIWDKRPYSIYLVTGTPYVEELEILLYEKNICYTRLEHIESLEELRNIVQNNYTYYFDVQWDIISFISSNNARHYSELSSILK